MGMTSVLFYSFLCKASFFSTKYPQRHGFQQGKGSVTKLSFCNTASYKPL